MYLLSFNLYEFGQFLQILLWISLPMVILVLLLTTYLHYRKKRRRQLEEEYVAGYPVEMDLSPGNGISADNTISAEAISTKSISAESVSAEAIFTKGISPENNITPKNGFAMENSSTMENSSSSDNGVSPENNANAYKGLLWMKDKYEQYREQTDNKYEKLREELVRSEQKYLDLLAEQAEQKVITSPASDSAASLPASDSAASLPVSDSATSLPAPGLLAALPVAAPAGDTLESPSIPDLVFEKERQIGFLHVELDQRIKNYHELEYQNREDKARIEELAAQYWQAQQLLEAQQGKINELNERLGHEMSKVAELTGKLENNMQLLLHIHQELDKSLHIQQPDESLPAQNERAPLTENTKIVGWMESEEAGV